MEINICFSSDNNYAKHMGVAITSILKNSNINDTYNFYILDGGISDSNKSKLNSLKNSIRNFSIEYLEINPDDFKKCPMTGYVKYITLPTYYRFKIPSLLPNLDKVLYLDCDIVVNSDISELYNTNIDDYYVGGIPEVFNHYHKERLEIIGNYYYINAGVLLINTKKWREDNIESKLFEYAMNPEREIVFQDQDVLNEVLKYNIRYIPLCWNLQHDVLFEKDAYLINEEEKNQALENPKLVHFTHKYKPWNYKCQNRFRKLYYKYLRQTPWKKDYYSIILKRYLSKILQLFYSKKEYNNKSKIKIFGIPVYKKQVSGFEIKKYLFGIKYSNTQDIPGMLKEAFRKQEEKINNLKDNIQVYSNMIAIQTNSSLCIYNQHQKVFPKYKNINQGKDVVLIATGPSLNNFIPLNNAIYIGVNKAFQYDKIKFDYLFIQDYSGQTKNYIDKFVNYNQSYTKKFIGFLNKNLEPNCIIPDKYSLYPNVERYYNIHPTLKSNFTYDIATEPLGDAYSVVFPAMQFILWTNPKRIYLVGCDCNTNGQFYGNTNNLAVNDVIDGWKKMKNFAKIYYPDTEIISINPVGLKGIFKDIYQDEEIKIQ